MAVTERELIVVLEHLGLETWQAEQAAQDPLLPWDDDGVGRCVAFIQRSTADRPAAVLWNLLSKRHTLPRAPTPDLRVVDPETAPYLCPVCHADFAVCGGMHGWAAQFRGMTPSDIYTPERPARRTRNAPYRAKNGAKEDT